MLPNPTRHLLIQIQQIADASDPDQASTSPIPANCRYFRPRPGIYKSNTSKLQMLPNPTRHLQIHIQQIADASEPRICIYKSNTSKLQMLPTPTRHLQIQYQQIADASNPDQASANSYPANCRCFHVRNSPLYVSTNPILANCRCFRPRPGIYKSNTSKLQMLPTLTRHLQVQY